MIRRYVARVRVRLLRSKVAEGMNPDIVERREFRHRFVVEFGSPDLLP